MDRNRCVIVVPIYKEKFDFDEYHSIKQLFNILPVEKYDIIAFGPESLDRTYYFNNFDFTDHYYFWDSYFTDYPKGYNSLMLNSGFYEFFNKYEFMLVYQPDAWVFRDELEYWCDKGYDFIGAPQIYNNINKYWLDNNTQVGNGGFSLRKIQFWINICAKYTNLINTLLLSNDDMVGEDHIITLLLSNNKLLNINIPSIIEAAKFGFDIQPHTFYQMIDHQLPFGCHAYNKVEDKDFYNNFIFYKKKLYSIVTYLFGDYDILRDPDEVDEGAEYICITDRDDLESDVWKFVKLDYPNIDQYNSWQKTMIARYTVLNYINTEYCVQIDASVKCKKSCRDLIYKVKSSNVDICLMPHPWRTDYIDEYNEWIKTRNLDPIQKDNFIQYCKYHNYDFNKKGMIMTTIMIKRNNEQIRKFDNYILNEIMKDPSIRVDQTYFSIILCNIDIAQNLCYYFISMQVLDSDYFEYYYHNSNYTHNGEYKYDLDSIDMKYLNGSLHNCFYLI